MQRLVDKIPPNIRVLVLASLFGIIGGLATVAFTLATNGLFALIWQRLTALSPVAFLTGSFLVVAVSSVAAGVLMARVCPAAAGSGVPQLKAAYWTELGVVPMRAVVVKFVGGVLTLAGGASLGREGPTVFLSGGLCSNVAAWLGIERRHRRHAAATGAAAGLAAAFNTPLAAVSFILEEILGDLGSRVIGSVVLASVTGAFIVYALIGKQPSFFMPSVDVCSWSMYGVVPVTGGVAALAGVLFQRACLGLRARYRGVHVIPAWLRPLTGGVLVWLIGSAVFLTTRHLGVFGLGYGDLSAALRDGIAWKVAGILAAAKLVATVLSYGSGGCGGIFSPTLFIGAMCGFFTAGVAGRWVPLIPADHLVLAAVGMCGCFGAVVRAPITGILMIFEMTHQFGMLPALMLGTLVSQSVSRLAGRHNFYNELLAQDGHEIHRIAPPQNLAGWRALPVATLANRNMACIADLGAESLRRTLNQYTFRRFPVMVGGVFKGVISREEIERALALGMAPELEPPVVFSGSQTLEEIDPFLVKSNAGLFAVTDVDGGPVAGIFTLHDLLRAQAAIME